MADNIVYTNSTAKQPVNATKVEPSSKATSSPLNALGPVVAESYTPDKYFNEHASNPTTPGDLFPGAFPKVKDSPSSSLKQDTDYVKEVASRALETANKYVHSASEVVGGYLPKSVAAYLPNNELPKQSHKTNPNSSMINSTASEPHSETISSPDGDFSEGGNIPGNVGIVGTTIIEDHSLGGRTAPRTKSTTPDVEIPAISEHNTLAPPNVGAIGDHNGLNDKGRALSTSPRQLDCASTDASIRTLPGSRVDTWSHVTTAANSTNGTHQADMRNTNGTMKTSFSAADDLQRELNTAQSNEDYEAHRPDPKHPHDEANHLDVPPVSDSQEKSAITHINSPVTTGREHLSVVEKSTKPRSDSKQFAHQDSLGSTVATPGHEVHGESQEKGRSNNVATSNMVASPNASQTGAWAGSVVTGIDTSASRPTINNAPTDDTGAWAANVVAGLDTPDADQNFNTKHIVASQSPAAQKRAIGTVDDAPSLTKDLPDTPDNRHASFTNAKTKKVSPTKPRFLDKLRGEMKILSGTLENSQEKIEEGRRMMGKPEHKN